MLFSYIQICLNIFYFISKMKYIFILLSLLFSQILSFKEIKPKLCVNCKYFITDKHDNKFGKCSLFIKEEDDNFRLVNGVFEDKNIEYQYCSVMRGIEWMCGKDGKMYKKKYTKKGISNEKR